MALFGSKENNEKTQDETMYGSINLIGIGTIITGDIVCKGDIRIDGVIQGNVSSKAKVVLGATGSVDGVITCQNADVSGYLNGNIKVSETAFLKASARLQGDISANKLIVEAGAVFTGNCNMGVIPEKAVKNIHVSKEKSERESEQAVVA